MYEPFPVGVWLGCEMFAWHCEEVENKRPLSVNLPLVTFAPVAPLWSGDETQCWVRLRRTEPRGGNITLDVRLRHKLMTTFLERLSFVLLSLYLQQKTPRIYCLFICIELDQSICFIH